jgi:hypothetical protein
MAVDPRGSDLTRCVGEQYGRSGAAGRPATAGRTAA